MSKWFRFARKLAKIFLIVSVVLLVLCVLWVQIENRVMRHRAERLIGGFNRLRVNQSTGADIQEFLNPWKAQIPSWETCTEKSCIVNFSISSHIFRFNDDTGPSGGIPTVWVQSLASADAGEVEPLTHFNVNCFTGWHSCSQADLMPEAWAKFSRTQRN